MRKLTYSFTLHTDLMKQIQKIAKDKGRSASSLVSEILTNYLKSQAGKRK